MGSSKVPCTLIACVILAGCDGDTGGYVGISDSQPTGSHSISADGLVASYDFETLTPDGRLRDFSAHQNHGNVSQTQTATSLFGSGRVFAEVADRVDLPEHASFDLDGPLTVATWVRVTGLDIHQHIFACDDKFALWITPRNQFRLGDTQGSGHSTVEGFVEANRWYSVVAILYGTRGDSLTDANVAMFVDGQRIPGSSDPTWSPTVLHPSDACDIGFESHQGNTAHQDLPFKGVIDELLILSRALTPQEVQAHAAH